MKIPQILTLIPFQGHMYKPKTSNFTFLNVKPDVFGYLQIFCGETGSNRVIFIRKHTIPSISHSTILQTFKCTVLYHTSQTANLYLGTFSGT